MIKKATIFILSIIGFLISVKLTQVYFNANFVLDAGPSFCTITKTINCDAVAQSKFAVFLGIPLAIWGMMLYLFLMFLTFVDEIGKFKLFGFLKAFKNPLNYIYVVSFVSLAVSIVLAMISFFIINKICVLCFATYLIDATIVIISGLKTNFVESVKICFSDLKEFLSEKFNKMLFAAAVVFFAVMVLLVNQYNVFRPFRLSESKFTVTGNVLGEENAKVVIHEYTDYMCPFCSNLNTELHQIASNVGNVRVIHHHFPLDKQCNKIVTEDFHVGSCMASRYALAAKKQGKFWEFSSLLYENNHDLSEDKMTKLALQVGLDIDKLKKDAYSCEVAYELKNDIQLALDQGLDSTPVLEINGKIYKEMMPYEDLESIVFKAGGSPKQKADVKTKK